MSGPPLVVCASVVCFVWTATTVDCFLSTLRALTCLWLSVVCLLLFVVCTELRLLPSAAEERGGCTRFSDARTRCVTSFASVRGVQQWVCSVFKSRRDRCVDGSSPDATGMQ